LGEGAFNTCSFVVAAFELNRQLSLAGRLQSQMLSLPINPKTSHLKAGCEKIELQPIIF